MNLCEENAMQCLKACGLAEADGSLTKDCRRLMVVFEAEKLRGLLDERTCKMVAAMVKELTINWEENAACAMLTALYRELNEPCPDFRAMQDAGIFLPEFFGDLCEVLQADAGDADDENKAESFEGADAWF